MTRTSFLPCLVAMAAAALAQGASAQGVFRIVGPDGRVSFSDKPPVDAPVRAAVAPGTAQPGAAGSGGPLPFELRQVAVKYPVTLYTSVDCVPCGAGKAFLSSRGVPFAEKTVTSREDIDALQRLAGDTSLPLLTIGGQQLKGYSDTEWLQFLDAAGYPKASQLPASYRNVPAAPLVAIQRPAVPTDTGPRAGALDGTAAPSGRRAAAVEGTATRPTQAPTQGPDNPAGIKF